MPSQDGSLAFKSPLRILLTTETSTVNHTPKDRYVPVSCHFVRPGLVRINSEMISGY